MRFAVIALAALALSVTALAAPPKKWYWSEEKAEAMAAAKVRIGYCLVFTSDEKCANGPRRPDGGWILGFYGLNEVTCTGADERGETFTFARFRCRFVAGVEDYDYARGSLTLYPTGKRTMRWKLTSLARVA